MKETPKTQQQVLLVKKKNRTEASREKMQNHTRVFFFSFKIPLQRKAHNGGGGKLRRKRDLSSNKQTTQANNTSKERTDKREKRTKREKIMASSLSSSSLLVLSFWKKSSFGGRRKRRSKRSTNHHPLTKISADSASSAHSNNTNEEDDSEDEFFDENNDDDEKKKKSFFFSTTTTIESTRGRRRRSRAANTSNNMNNNSSQEEELSSTIIRNSVIKNSNKSSSSSQSSAFELAGGFLYVRNFFEKEDFEKIARACDDLRKHLKEEKRVCANSRLGVMVPEEDVVHQMCCSEFAAEKLRELVLSDEEKLDANKRNALKPSDVPVEYRIYPFGGSMDWHRDVALYTEPQFEIVCTIHNSSDSRTEWKDVDTGRRRGIRSEPNSVLIVQADSVVHRVTPITKGERSIVKFAYSTTNEKTVDYYDNLLTYNDDYEPTEGSNGKRAATTSSSSSSTSENFPSPH
jgi:hypothetical protein